MANRPRLLPAVATRLSVVRTPETDERIGFIRLMNARYVYSCWQTFDGQHRPERAALTWPVIVIHKSITITGPKGQQFT